MGDDLAREHIEGLRVTLEQVKRTSELGSDDPAILELERIIMSKVAEWEAVKADTERSFPIRG